jgi:hypothetical protein
LRQFDLRSLGEKTIWIQSECGFPGYQFFKLGSSQEMASVEVSPKVKREEAKSRDNL